MSTPVPYLSTDQAVYPISFLTSHSNESSLADHGEEETLKEGPVVWASPVRREPGQNLLDFHIQFPLLCSTCLLQRLHLIVFLNLIAPGGHTHTQAAENTRLQKSQAGALGTPVSPRKEVQGEWHLR